jgi:hypothetical protein
MDALRRRTSLVLSGLAALLASVALVAPASAQFTLQKISVRQIHQQ